MLFLIAVVLIQPDRAPRRGLTRAGIEAWRFAGLFQWLIKTPAASSSIACVQLLSKTSSLWFSDTCCTIVSVYHLLELFRDHWEGSITINSSPRVKQSSFSSPHLTEVSQNHPVSAQPTQLQLYALVTITGSPSATLWPHSAVTLVELTFALHPVSSRDLPSHASAPQQESPSLNCDPHPCKENMALPLRLNSTFKSLRSPPRSLFFQTPSSTLFARTFSSSPNTMAIKAYFDVEYTDAALDKQISDAQRRGESGPARKLMTSSLNRSWLPY